MPVCRAILLVLVMVLMPGCAWWEEAPEESSFSFPTGRMAADAVGLELAVAQLDLGQADTFEDFWELLDAQELPLETRRRLDHNGIRAAVMSSHPPPMLQDLVQPKTLSPNEMNVLETQLSLQGLLQPTPRMVTHDRISNREGQVHAISVSAFHANVSWVIRDGDTQTPGYGENVRGVIAITTYPQGDGSVRLILHPEIHHGHTNQRIGVGGGSFLIESGQRVIPIEELKMDVTLRAGESIVLAPTSDVSDLGKLFFGRWETDHDLASKKSPLTHRVLLIRVVQTQMDDLFSDINMGEKLTNSVRH